MHISNSTEAAVYTPTSRCRQHCGARTCSTLDDFCGGTLYCGTCTELDDCTVSRRPTRRIVLDPAPPYRRHGAPDRTDAHAGRLPVVP